MNYPLKYSEFGEWWQYIIGFWKHKFAIFSFTDWIGVYIFYINNQDQKKGQEAENRMETENVFEAPGSKTMA